MSAANAPAWSRKGRVVLLTIISAAIVFASTTQTWLRVDLPEQAVPTPDLTIAGSEAATAVTALALVALAGALASTIAGRIARLAIAVIILAAAAGIIASALSVMANPRASSEGQVADAIGIIGSSAQTSVTVFPAIAVAGGGLLAVSAVVIVLAGRYWGRTKRFDTDASSTAGTSGTAAGASARGPAAGAGGSTTADPARPGEPASADEADEEPADEIESWDQLSRGKDPTG
ncbi:Trp biosynthesis-associated membrane protein [Arthrobacter monumenti]